jgi:hypothetical protein
MSFYYYLLLSLLSGDSRAKLLITPNKGKGNDRRREIGWQFIREKCLILTRKTPGKKIAGGWQFEFSLGFGSLWDLGKS